MKTLSERTAEAATGRELLRLAARSGVIITTDGRPKFAIVAIPDGEDAEDFATASNPAFRRIIRRSWQAYRKEGGISHAEMKRRFGIRK